MAALLRGVVAKPKRRLGRERKKTKKNKKKRKRKRTKKLNSGCIYFWCWGLRFVGFISPADCQKTDGKTKKKRKTTKGPKKLYFFDSWIRECIPSWHGVLVCLSWLDC